MTRKKIPAPTPEQIIQRIQEIREVGFIGETGEFHRPWLDGMRRYRYWKEPIEPVDDSDNVEGELWFCTT